MEQWDETIQEDHEALASQAEALEAALTLDIASQDRRVVISWIIRTLHPVLELHLRKEREALFPALEHLLGGNASALTLLQEEHQELQEGLRRLSELTQAPDRLDWEIVNVAGDSFLELLEDHEKKTNRLLLDVLQFNLKPKELKGLALAFREVARKAYEEEGWPKSPAWSRKYGTGAGHPQRYHLKPAFSRVVD